MLSLPKRTNNKSWMLFALVASVLFVSTSMAQPSIKGLKFEVLSVRPMTDQEIKNLGDIIGPDLIVRFRLSNVGRGTLYYWAINGEILPNTNLIRGTEKKYEWYKFPQWELLQTSPGMSTTRGPSNWLALDRGSAVEWETFDLSEYHGNRHASTVFIKEGPNGEVREIPSTFYHVPERPKK